MNDYRAIDKHIRQARLEHSAFMGELIASAIFSVWCGAKRLAIRIGATLKELVETPDQYSTGLPRFGNH